MRVELHRIGADIYINGRKVVFALDFNAINPTLHPEFCNVDWLIAWAKVGLLSRGHNVPHFEIKDLSQFGNLQPMVGEKGP